MDRLKALLSTMTTQEIRKQPMLAACYIYMLCQETGVPVQMVTAAMATGDYSELDKFTSTIVDLSPTYWQDFTQDALNQAEDIIGGE